MITYKLYHRLRKFARGNIDFIEDFSLGHAEYPPPKWQSRDGLRGQTLAVRRTDDDRAPLTGLCGGIQPDGSLRIGETCVYAGEAHVVQM